MKVELGAGPHGMPGYIHTDVRPLPGVDVVCSSTQLPFEDGSVEEIFGRHTLEHASQEEGERILQECFRVLMPGGTIYLIVPNIEAHVWQWVTGNRRHSAAGFWGWQQHEHDFHKWGYDWLSLRDTLREAGFESITNLTGLPESRERSLFHLEIVATKPRPGQRTPEASTGAQESVALERLVPGTARACRSWALHLKRYDFAIQYASNRPVLDIGCGMGYGTAHIASHVSGPVTGVDISAEAIEWAKRNCPAERLSFQQCEAERLPFEQSSFGLVVCFEVIEHIARPHGMLAEAARVLAPDGYFVVSTPNKLTFSPNYPDNCSPNPFHVREYRLDELVELLNEFFRPEGVFIEGYTPSYEAHVRAVSAIRARLAGSRISRCYARFRRCGRGILSLLVPPVGKRILPDQAPKSNPDVEIETCPLATQDDVTIRPCVGQGEDGLYFVVVCRNLSHYRL